MNLTTTEAERQMSHARLMGDYLLYLAYAHDLGQAEHMEFALSLGRAYDGFLTALTFLNLRFGDKQQLVPELLALRAERKRVHQ
jgi:hypothetical protein